MDLAAGDRVGRYVVEARIGAGSRGSVYRAAREGGGRIVALKVIAPMASVDLVKCVASVRSAAALAHPNIAAVVEVGTHEEALFIARELVPGTTIVARAKSATREERIRALIAAAGALHFAHTRGVVHGAVREGNVLIEEDGTLKVTDFAIGEARDALGDRRAWIDLANAILEKTDFSASVREALEAAAGENGSLDRAASTLEAAIDEPAEAIVTPAIAHVPEAPGARPEETIAPAGTLRTASRDPFDARRFALVAVIIACSIVVLYATRRKPSPAARGTIDAGAPIGSMSTTRGASSPSPQAVALFNGAMQSMRDASIDQARATLDDALRVDPSYAAAHLRRALLSTIIDNSSREHFRRAMSLRNGLTQHELVLLDAFEPTMRSRPDFGLSVARMESASKNASSDADFLFHLGLARWLAGDFARSVAEMDRTLELEPGFALASRTRALLLSLLGNAQLSIAEYERCLRLSPAATKCLFGLAETRAHEGDCKGAEAATRRMLSIDPGSAEGYYMLVLVLAAQHQEDAASLAVQEYVRRLPPAERAIQGSAFEAERCVLRGDFSGAERALDAWEIATESSSDEWEHYATTELRMELDMETGRPAEATAVGNAFLARQTALTPASYHADARLLVVGAMHRANGASGASLEALRRNALAALPGAGESWEAQEESHRAWIWAYVPAVATRDEARAAIAALSTYPTLPPSSRRHPIEVDGMIGHIFLLAGDIDRAQAPLQRAARSCVALEAPIFHTQLLVDFADVERAQDDREGACNDYAEVLRRWGDAQPKSRTATHAKAAYTALRCAL